MSQESKMAGAQYASYLRLLPQSVIEANHRRAQPHAQKVADAFAVTFAEGTCPTCKNALSSYTKDAPCLHWLLKPEGFEKDDFPRIAERYSLAQIELFIRRVANQEAFAKNINNMADEGTGKLVEVTTKYKDFEWAISCGKSDYDGHGNTEESRRAHYHFQMRIDGKRFIDYSDYHLPLHHSDILTMEAARLAPGKIKRNYAGGEGMDMVFKEDVVEKLLAQGDGGDMLSATHIIERKGLDAGAFLDQLRAAKADGRPVMDVVRGVEDAKVTTLVEPGSGVVHQAVRQGRGRRVVTNDLPE
ncbi:hypothetical protein Q3C01_32230 [Bradyrhizobium sp. UFLA05-109]